MRSVRGVEMAEEGGGLADGWSEVGHLGLCWLRLFLFLFCFLF